MTEMSFNACKWCGRTIGWCLSENARPLSLDPTPNPAGNVIVAVRDGRLVGHVLHKGETVPPDQSRFMPHIATCPEHPTKRVKESFRDER